MLLLLTTWHSIPSCSLASITFPERRRLLLLDVNIVEATGREPYRGDVLIIGEAMFSDQLYPHRIHRNL